MEKAESGTRPPALSQLETKVNAFLTYIVLPFVIIFLLGVIGRGMMSDDDKAYVQTAISITGFHKDLDRALLENAIYIYATPVFLIPWLLYEISKRFFQSLTGVLKATEVIATFPFFVSGLVLVSVYLKLMGFGKRWDEVVDRLMLPANVVGTLFIAAFQARLVSQLILFVVLLQIVLILSIAVFDAFKAVPTRKKTV